jgi:hypothetical protein
MNEMLTDSTSILQAWHMSGTRVVLGTREVLQGPSKVCGEHLRDIVIVFL